MIDSSIGSVAEMLSALSPFLAVMNQQSDSIRVAIVGGGIAGLALATFLSTTSSGTISLDIDIYENAPSLTELGAGLGLWRRAWHFLADADPALAHDLKAVAPEGKDFTDALQKAFEFRKGDRSPEGLSFFAMVIPFGVMTLHRADFQRVLARHAIPPARPHFGKKFTGYDYADENDPSSEIILKFADGSRARADLLVGADGIRSPVRHEMARRLLARGQLKPGSDSDSDSGNANTNTGADATASGVSSSPSSVSQNPDVDVDKDTLSDLVEPVWSGTIVYRSLIPFEVLEARFPGHRAGRGPVMYFGKNKHIVAYPISASASAFASANADANAGRQNSAFPSAPALESESAKPTPIPTPTPTRMVNLVAFVSDPSREGTRLPRGEPWVRPALREEVLDQFEGWEKEVRVLLDLAEKPLAWAVHTVRPLPRYSDPDGRVVLLGDAAHAMTPHQGAGGGQAIEDAHVLASLLLDPRISRSTLPGALRAYDAVRVPISQRVVRSSRMNGLMYELNHSWAWEEGEGEGGGEGEGEDPNFDGDQGQGQDDEGEGAGELRELRELKRLRKLALAIMDIHKWEWEDQAAMQEDGKSQAGKARRLFEEFLSVGSGSVV